MTLQKFLTYIEQTKKLFDVPVVCFSSKVYPLLFFYYIFSFLKKKYNVINYINCGSIDLGSIKALLSTLSFSETHNIYWLEGFYTLSAKKQQELWAYCKNYTGPHRVLFFSHDVTHTSGVDVQNVMTITLPDKIASHEFSLLRFLVNNNTVQPSSLFAQKLTAYTDHLSLDSAALFADYEVVVGKNTTDFFSHWVAHIIEPTSSLFVLSQHFFSKKRSLFFMQWAAISPLYAPTFWATFWADQIWRAYIFCNLMKQKKYPESKKAQYKLPFSFINRDWSSYSATELRNAHHFLFELDYRLKNGGSEIGLEHFYSQFFDNKFRA